MEQKNELVHLFMTVGRLHRRCIENTVRGLKIHHSQHRLLVELSHHDALPTQKDLAERLDVSTAAVAVTLKKLEENGYIDRKADEGDTRFNRIALTEKGEAILKETRTLFDGVDEAMLAGIPDEEQALLLGCLSRMKENLIALCDDLPCRESRTESSPAAAPLSSELSEPKEELP